MDGIDNTDRISNETEDKITQLHRHRGRSRLADVRVVPTSSTIVNSELSASTTESDSERENQTYRQHRRRGRPRLADTHVGFNSVDLRSQRIRIGQSCNREVRNMVISNESGLEVSVSLWSKLARQHTDDDLRAYGDGNIVLILTSCKVQLFKGEPCLTSTVSSQLYFNFAIPIIETYKSMYVPPPVVFKSHEHHSEDLRVTKVAELFSYLQEGVIEGTMYIIDATIVDVDLVNDWKYVKCSRCRKKTTLNGDRYFCASCDTVVLVIRVVDKGEELSCVLFDKAVFSLLGNTANELLTRSFSEGADDPYWIEDFFFFDTLLGQRVILKIKIDIYNLAPNYVRRFTVSKYIGDDVKLLNKDKPMSTTCTSQALPSNYVSDGDVDDTIDDYSPITDDEWAMSDEAMWGPRITPLSELTITNDEHDVSSQGASGNIDADTTTPSSSVGKTKVEEHVSPYKLRPKKIIKKPKKLKD
ncbi:hypothetical protein R6Q57_029283 [Mikania cordata]